MQCPPVCKAFVVNRTFVEGFPSSIRHNMHSVWSSHKHAEVQELAYHATSLTKLNKATREGDKSKRYRSPPAEISRNQVVNRKGEEVASTQFHPQPVDDKQRSNAKLDDKLQFLTHMEDEGAQDEQHHNLSQPNLQMIYCIVQCLYYSPTKPQNVPSFLRKVGIRRQIKKVKQQALKGSRSASLGIPWQWMTPAHWVRGLWQRSTRIHNPPKRCLLMVTQSFCAPKQVRWKTRISHRSK